MTTGHPNSLDNYFVEYKQSQGKEKSVTTSVAQALKEAGYSKIEGVQNSVST